MLVTGVAPNSGLEDGGTDVIVSGTDFQDGADVHFGISPATDISYGPTQISCKTPAGIGVVDVVVTNPDLSTATLFGGFSYTIQQTSIEVQARIGDGMSDIFRSSPGLCDMLNKIAINLGQIIAASQQDTFAEFKSAMEDVDMLQAAARPRYVTAYQESVDPIKIPERLGEGLSGLTRSNSSDYVGLLEVLVRVSVMLEAMKTASQAINFDAFKTSMAGLPELVRSDDSTV